MLEKKGKINEWITAIRYYLYRFVPIQKTKIVFCNYNGKGYSCNPKYIAQELIKRHPSWDYVWLVSDCNTKLPKEIRTVLYDSKEAIYELATAGVWIDNQRKLWFHRKRKNQFFIATWHGAGIPIKKIGADNPNNERNKPYAHTSKHMNRIANMMISNSLACTQIFRRAFLYRKEILNCGYPRNDIFFQSAKQFRDKVRKTYNIGIDTHIVLYAPTYRNGRMLNSYTLDCSRMLQALHKKYGGKWIMMLRLHPSMKERTWELVKNNDIIDSTSYDDVQELLVASDVLISDYSSVITEFALQKKPVFLYATDISSYSYEREFYCDYRNLPFPLIEENNQIESVVDSFQQGVYEHALIECFQQYGIIETGNASCVVVDRIEEWVMLNGRHKDMQ